MATKTTGQKTRRTSVKKLKEPPKELTAKEQKKVRGGIFVRPRTNHNETVVRDSTRQAN